MAATNSPKSALSRKNMVIQALFVLGILLLGRFLWMRQRTQRLLERPGSLALLGVFGENQYLSLPGSQSTFTLMVQSLHGGPPHVICKEEAGWSLYPSTGPSDRTATVVNGTLYYAMVHPANTGAFNYAGAARREGVKQETVRNLGTFLLHSQSASKAEVSGRKRTISHNKASSSQDFRFRQVASQGGAPRDVAAIQGSSISLIGGHIFWIKPAAEDIVTIDEQTGQGRVFWSEISAHSDLMLTSLADGTTRCIRRGIPRATGLIKGGSGVSWTEPAPYPTPPTAFYARASDGSVHALGHKEDAMPYTEFGNRLYWVTSLPNSPNDTSGVSLMSVNLDGTEKRVVYAETNRRPIKQLQIFVSEGSLYGQLMEPGETVDTICRLHPDRAEPIEVLRKILHSGIGWVDSGYLYFDNMEAREACGLS